MNICRLALITLSLTLLVACGGGGGSTAAAPTTPTNGSERTVNPLANLTNFVPTENSSSIQAVQGIVSTGAPRINTGRIFEEGNSDGVETTCNMNGCIALLPGTTVTLPFLNNIVTDISLVSNFPSFFSDSSYSSEITNGITIEGIEGITFARGKLTGTRDEDDTPLAFETLAGWLNGSVFGVTQIAIGASDSTQQHRFIPYNAGIPTGSDPSGTGSATWEGAAVATVKADRTFVQGDATVTIADLASPTVEVLLEDLQDINDPEGSDEHNFRFRGMSLDGSGGFDTLAGPAKLEGRFYGTDHTEVGGWFSNNMLTGAFGATKQEGR